MSPASPALWELAPSTVCSHCHKSVSLKVRVGQRKKNAFSGHSHVLHPGPHPHTGSTTKALKSLFGFKDELWSPLLPNHSADLMASTQAIKII